MSAATTSFSIENEINPATNAPFGSKYAGTFNIRRPSLRDRNMADIKKAAMLNAYGTASLDLIGDWTKTSSYIFALVSTIATEKLPEWFDLGNIYDETDEDAFMRVWEVTGKFLDSFRPEADSGASAAGSN